jgi:hypothetical protein
VCLRASWRLAVFQSQLETWCVSDTVCGLGVSQNQSGDWVCLRASWRLGVSQSQSGGWVSQSQLETVCLRASLEAGCVSEPVWRLGVPQSHLGAALKTKARSPVGAVTSKLWSCTRESVTALTAVPDSKFHLVLKVQ